jgi:hypothetical protein
MSDQVTDNSGSPMRRADTDPRELAKQLADELGQCKFIESATSVAYLADATGLLRGIETGILTVGQERISHGLIAAYSNLGSKFGDNHKIIESVIGQAAAAGLSTEGLPLTGQQRAVVRGASRSS